MPPDVATVQRGATTVVAARTMHRASRSGALWGAVAAVYVVASSYGYSSTYPTAASRARVASSLGANAGLAALLGPARHLETVAGFTAWRALGVLSVVAAIWGMLLATRLTRGEEDEGRCELLLSGQTTRRGAGAQAVAGLGAGLIALWAVTGLGVAAVGSSSKVNFSVSASLFFATTIAASAAMFLGVGVLCAQLAPRRRQANGIAAGVLGASFLIRMAADSGSGLVWLRWATPLGWVEELRPLTGSKSMGLLPIAVLVFVLGGASVAIAGRRDLGASVLPSRDTSPPHTALLGGPTGLAVRLGRGVAIGWIAGLAVLGLVLGLVAQSASAAVSGSATIQKAIARLGGHRSGAATYLGIAFLTSAAIVAFMAAGQVSAARQEESDGHVEHLLVRAVSRRRWLAGRIGLGACITVAASLVTGLAAWAGAATQHSGVGLGDLTQAGLNIAPPALFVLGVGALAYGLRPRMASAITYGLVSWSLLIELIASVVKSNRLLLDSSVFAHITPAPAANPNWGAAGWLAGLGLAAAAVGIVAFQRRDLAGA